MVTARYGVLLACGPDGPVVDDTQGTTAAASTGAPVVTTGDTPGGSSGVGDTSGDLPGATTSTGTSGDGTSGDGTSGEASGDPTGESTGALPPGCGDGVAMPGELCFTASTLLIGWYARGVGLPDLDGDGYLDLVVASFVAIPLTGPLPLSGGPRPAGRESAHMHVDVARGDGLGGFEVVQTIVPGFEGSVRGAWSAT